MNRQSFAVLGGFGDHCNFMVANLIYFLDATELSRTLLAQ